MNNELSYILKAPEAAPVPFLLSIPHCGIDFPGELSGQYVPELAVAPDDTDWFLQDLYDFAADLGVTTIHARYSRWVIDLNREPGSKPLYDDGRLITELCPTTDFLGQPIYVDPESEPSEEEKERRLEKYFRPYHEIIDDLLTGFRANYGNVIFWDGHSIRRFVQSISKKPFPDFILGNNDGKTASARIIEQTLSVLNKSGSEVSHNDPFKGGYLTRSKGDPGRGIHALQLEMSKDLYMDRTETIYDTEKAAAIKALLKTVFERLIEIIGA